MSEEVMWGEKGISMNLYIYKGVSNRNRELIRIINLDNIVDARIDPDDPKRTQLFDVSGKSFSIDIPLSELAYTLGYR